MGCSCDVISGYGESTGGSLIPPVGCNDSRVLAFAPGDILRFTVTIGGIATVLEQEVPDMLRSGNGQTIFMPSSAFDYSVCDTYYGSACDTGITPYTYNVNPLRPSSTSYITAYNRKIVNGYGYRIYTNTDMSYAIATSTPTSIVLVLDPSIDTGLSQLNAANNFGTCPNMTIGTSAGNAYRAAIKFDLSSIPAGSNIVSASLDVDIPSLNKTVGSGVVNVHRLTTDFTEGTQCASAGSPNWTTPWTTAGGDYNSTVYGTISFLNNEYNVKTVALTSLVQYWVNNSALNYGLLMKLSVEGAGGNYMVINSDETSGIGNGSPILTIAYRP
jgi:hypothetical protein